MTNGITPPSKALFWPFPPELTVFAVMNVADDRLLLKQLSVAGTCCRCMLGRLGGAVLARARDDRAYIERHRSAPGSECAPCEWCTMMENGVADSKRGPLRHVVAPLRSDTQPREE